MDGQPGMTLCWGVDQSQSFAWNIATSICLPMVYGHFVPLWQSQVGATETDGLQSCKIFTMWPFNRKSLLTLTYIIKASQEQVRRLIPAFAREITILDFRL